MAALILVAAALPGPARAQSGTGEASEILLHPGVPTILHLPDEIEEASVHDREELRIAVLRDKLFLRPRPGTPAGTEALLDVKTRTLRRTFRLRVVRRARDAHLDILVLPAQEEQDGEEPTPEIPPVAPPEEASAASASANATPPPAPPIEPEPAPAPAEPRPTPMPPEPEHAPVRPAPVTGRDIEPTNGRATAANASRFELSVHGFTALVGTTELKVAGYEAIQARQSHRAFGGRVALRPRGACWAVEGNVSGEWPAAPTVHRGPNEDGLDRREVDGPRLRADAGMRAGFGTSLRPTAHAAIGLQVHHRDTEETNKEGSGDMPFEGVLAVGMGLEYRAGNLLLGLDLHVRQAIPAEYRSVSVVLSLGFSIDQENEP